MTGDPAPVLRESARPLVNVRVWVHDRRRGSRVLWDEGHNLVTAAGLNLLRDRLRGASGVEALSHTAVGTGSNTPAAGDTTLQTEVFRDVFTQVTVSAATIVIRYYLGPNDANGNTLREAGLLNAAAAGVLYARRLFATPIVKTIDLAVTVEWTLTFAAV